MANRKEQQELLDLERSTELSGPVERLRSSFLGGVKHMPIRYNLQPAA